MTGADAAIPDSFDGENVATARFRPFSNPATADRIQFTVAGEGSDNDVRFKWCSLPGEAHFTVNGEERVVRAGERIVVPVGVRHSELRQTQDRPRSWAWSSSGQRGTAGWRAPYYDRWDSRTISRSEPTA